MASVRLTGNSLSPSFSVATQVASRVAFQVDELPLDDVTDHRAAARAEVADRGEFLRAGELHLRRARGLRCDQGVQSDARAAGRDDLEQLPPGDGHSSLLPRPRARKRSRAATAG